MFQSQYSYKLGIMQISVTLGLREWEKEELKGLLVPDLAEMST